MFQTMTALGYLKHPRRLFYGWWLIGISLFIFAIVIGPAFLGLGTFMVALERHFGWSRTALSGAFSLSRFEGAFLGPVEGYLTDRWGARRIIFIGFVILGAGMVGLSLIRDIIGFYLAFLVIFTGAGLAGFLPLMSIINNWFKRHRTLATAIVMCGTSLGGLLVPALAWAVTSFGWQATALSLGITIWALAIPVTRLIRNRPEDYGVLPDGAISSVSTPVHEQNSTEEELSSFTAFQAMRTWAFWTIGIAHGFGATAFVTITIHIMPALTDSGMSLQMASTIIATYTSVALIFQLLGGFLGDRLPKPPLIAIFITLQGLGALVLALTDGIVLTFVFAVLFGMGFGGRVPLLVSLRGEYFGRKAFATILGLSQLPMNLIMVGAIIAAGYIYDVQGSYLVPFLGLSFMCFLGAVCILVTRKPILKYPGRPTGILRDS